MSIGNALLSLMSGGQQDPRTALLGAAMGQPAGDGTPQAGAPPAGGGAAPQPPQAQAYQSPQELMQLYESLMTRQERASNLDRGIGLIASSFSQPENRANVLNAATGGGSGGEQDMMANILAIQQSQVAQQEQKAALARRNARASGIASEFGISENVAFELSEAEELDAYLLDQLKFRDPNTEVVSADDGSVRVINKNDGTVVNEVLGPNGQPTADIKNYDRYRTDQEAKGEPAMPFEEFIVLAPAAGASRIDVNNVSGEKTTALQTKIDENFAPIWQDWVGGGFADTNKQITQLNKTLEILESDPNSTGPVQAGLAAVGLDSLLNPNGTIAREGVEEVVQRSLREILGAQFTEREGERLIARAYNSALPPAENTRRVKLLLGQIRAMGEARQAQVDYANEHGTLVGFRGKSPEGMAGINENGELRSLEREFGADPEGDPEAGITRDYQDGDIAENEAGDRIIRRNGKWEPM